MVLTAEPTADVVVEIDGHTTGGDVTVNGSSAAVSLTFTTGTWNTAQTVTVAAVDDGVTEGEESVTLTHTVTDADSAAEYAGVTGESVTVTVTDPAGVTVSPTSLDVVEGASGTYEVVLTAEPTADVVVEIDGHTTGGDVTVDGSSAAVSLTFTTGTWNTAQTVTVAAVDDGVTEGEESVTLTHTVTDADSAAEYAGVTGASVTVTVTDPAGVTVSPTSLNITEGASDTYEVVLTSEPTADVVVEIDGHTTGGVVTVDGSSSVVALTFTTGTWNTAQTVTVAAVDNSVADGEESVSLTHAVVDADSATEYAGVTGESVAVTVTDNDSAGVTVNPTSLNITEGASDTYTVVLTAEPTADVVVEISGHTTGGVVTVDGSSSAVSLTFTTGTWNTAQTVTVAAVDDSTAGGTESVSLTHTITDADSAAEYRDVTVASVAVTVTDNDSAGVTVNPTTLNITEGASGSYTVELTAEPTADVVVEVGGHTGVGVVTVDGSSAVVSLTFTTGDWNTAQTVTVAAADDDVDDGDESVTLTHAVVDADSATEYAGVTGASVTVTVTDNDSAGVAVSPTTLNITEGASDTYSVELTAEPTGDVVVEIAGHVGGGVVTVDGSSSAVSLTFTTGTWSTAQTVTVAAVDDSTAGGNESVSLTHAVKDADSATEYAGVTGAPVTVTVTDDDSAGVTVNPMTLSISEGASGSYTVELTSEPTGDVVVEIGGHTTGGVVTVDGSSSVVSLTFTTGDWNTAQTVTVAAVDDSTAGGTESVSLTHAVVDADSAAEYAGVTGASVTVTVTDNDSAGVTVSPTTLNITEGASGSYSVVLTSEPTGDVVVEIGGHAGGGVVTVDGSSAVVALTFTTASWNTAQTVTVAAVDDSTAGGTESVSLTHAVVDADSAAEYRDVTVASVAVTVTDNDSAGVTVNPTSLNITEGASDTYTVVLTAEPTADVVVEISGHTTGGVVTVDGSSSAVSLTFMTGTWSTAQTVTVAAVDDSTAGGTESVSLTHAVKDADSATEYAGVTGASVTVTVTDDDTAGVTVNPTTLSITEGASGSYTVVLTSAPTAAVVVAVGGHTTGGDVTVNASSAAVSLTFTTGTWNTAQTVTVAAVDDGVTEGEESVTLTHAVVDADSATEYAGVTGASVTVTVTDTAGVTVSFEKDFHRTSEGASGAFATVRLSAALQQAVTIPINVSSTTTAEANDYRLSTDPFQGDPNYAAVPTSGTFDVTFEVGDSAAYFAIRALPDTVFENDETVVLEFGTLPTGISTGSPSATTFHLIDTQTASFGAASYSATEGGPGATVTVNLDYAVSAIVCLEVENHAGTSDGDYAGVPDDLNFAGTETSRSFVVTVADDADSEGGSITIGLGCLSGELREGSPSSTTVILLDDDPPGGNDDADGLPAPRGFTATYVTLDGNYYNKTQDSVTLLWWPLDRAERYKLEYRRTTEGGDWTIVAGDFEEYTGGGNGPVAVAAGLECDTEYDFRLSAAGAEDTDVGGFGAYAETRARTGPCPKQALVTNILVATTPACATLHWTAPLDGRAVAHRVRRTDLAQPAVTTTLTASVAGTTFRHCPPGGYPPGSGYLFWVAALTAGGEVYGEHNSQIEATGPKGPPSVARNLRFTRQSPQVRSLAWDPPVNHWLTTVSEATDGDGYSNEVADPWVSYVVQRGELEPGSVPGHETLVDGTWRDLREVTGTTFSDRENIGGRIFVYRVLAKNLNGFAVGYHPEIWMERPTTSLQRRDAPDVGGLQESDTPPQLQTAEFQENSEVPALPPLTAGYRDAPVSHDGQGSFTFELRFSEEVELSYVTLRDEAFRVTGGTVITARRLNSPSNIRWRIEIQPAPDGDVTVLLPGTTDCGAEGAVCTEDGRKLSNGLALVVSGPA